MALEFADSFSRYKIAHFDDAALAANFNSRYTASNLGVAQEIDNTGRTGQCLRMHAAGQSFFKTLRHASRWVVGFAFRADATSGASETIYALLNNNLGIFSLRHNADRTLSLWGGPFIFYGAPFATSTRALLQGRWYFLEVDISVSGTPNLIVTAELRINGKVECSGTLTVPDASGSPVPLTALISQDATANVHLFNSWLGILQGYSLDDLYIKTGAGYYGDLRIRARYPNGDATPLDWTPDSGTVHFDRVNTHPVDLTKNLSDDVPTHVDLWEWEDCGISGTIVGIDIGILARKDDEGTKSFKIKVGGSPGAESDEHNVSDVNPEYYEYCLEIDPNTGVAYTPASFNAILAGAELIS
jgi:hypothetical protein